MHFKWLQIAELFPCFGGEIAWGKLLALYALNIKTKCQVGKCNHWRLQGVTDGDYRGRDCCWRCSERVGPGFCMGPWEGRGHGGLEFGLCGQRDLLQTPARDEGSHGDVPLRQRVLCGILGNAGAGPSRGGRYSSLVLVNPRPENPLPTPPSPPWNHPLPCRVRCLHSLVAVMLFKGTIATPWGDANVLSVTG